MFKFVKLATRKYPDIHQLHTLYVEKKSGNVYIEDGTPLFDSSFFCPEWFRESDWWIMQKYVEYWDKFFSNLTLDPETMDLIKEIVENRNEEEIETNKNSIKNDELMINRIACLLESFDAQISKNSNNMKWKIEAEKLIITLPLYKDKNNSK